VTAPISTRRSGEVLGAILAALSLEACLTENVHAKSVGPESRQLVPGPLLENPPPGAVVVLHDAGGKLSADVRWMGVCSQTEHRVAHRQLRVTKEVSTTAYVISGILGGIGLALYMWPDGPEGNKRVGAILGGAGVLTYVIPAHRAGETKRELPPEVSDSPAPSAVCFIGNATYEPIVVRGSDATLEGTTDGSGHILFDSTLSAPVEVMVSGRPAQKVEWQR
jgi:hypothetical protein